MTKSQNTKNEQQKDLCITNEKLTEQWKIGELPEDLYWVKHDGVINILDNLEISLTNVEQVLAPVPSYDELQNMNKAVNECMAANIKLVEENKQLKEQINHLLKTQARQFVDNQKLQVKAEKAKDVVNIDTARQIKQLKELLKECRLAIFDYPPYDLASDKIRLTQKIDEVLK